MAVCEICIQVFAAAEKNRLNDGRIICNGCLEKGQQFGAFVRGMEAAQSAHQQRCLSATDHLRRYLNSSIEFGTLDLALQTIREILKPYELKARD